MSNYKKFYLSTVLGTTLISFYPIYMLIKVIADYAATGSVDIANYPKYIIPYTPISIALIFSACFMPAAFSLFKRFALPVISALGIILFFIAEFALENMVVIDGTNLITKVENWQMFSCVATPQVRLTAGDILVGNYSPALKTHFYIISIIIILAVVNVIHGFSKMIKTNDFSRKSPFIAQTISVTVFIGLCIFACFTAFYRTGSILVSPVSAVLMCLFFITMGVTSGTYIGSFFYNRSKLLSVTLPAVVSLVMTLVMYVGELILLNGNLYQFGTGSLFRPVAYLPFTIVDIAVMLISGVITYVIMLKLNSKTGNKNQENAKS